MLNNISFSLYLDMERLTIQVPEKKSKLIKSLLKELGVKIETDLYKITSELDETMPEGKKPSIDEIVAEIHAYRTGH